MTTVGLLNARGHRTLLDEYGGHQRLSKGDKSGFFSLFSGAVQILAKALSEAALIREEEDFLRHALKELEALATEPGEEAELDAKRRMMQASERIRDDVRRAHSVLD